MGNFKEELNYFYFFKKNFIVIQVQLYAFSPHSSTPPQLNPPPVLIIFITPKKAVKSEAKKNGPELGFESKSVWTQRIDHIAPQHPGILPGCPLLFSFVAVVFKISTSMNTQDQNLPRRAYWPTDMQCVGSRGNNAV